MLPVRSPVTGGGGGGNVSGKNTLAPRGLVVRLSLHLGLNIAEGNVSLRDRLVGLLILRSVSLPCSDCDGLLILSSKRTGLKLPVKDEFVYIN